MFIRNRLFVNYFLISKSALKTLKLLSKIKMLDGLVLVSNYLIYFPAEYLPDLLKLSDDLKAKRVADKKDEEARKAKEAESSDHHHHHTEEERRRIPDQIGNVAKELEPFMNQNSTS